MSPSTVTSWRARTTCISASTIRFARKLAARIIRLFAPSRGPITTLRLNLTRAVGRENFENTSPVISASASNPVSASIETRIFENSVTGSILPYPIVAIVCTLKKNMSANDPECAFSMPWSR